MNPKDVIIKDLMIHVERIVRPVRADHSKMRMRRELLAHLQSAYEEERAGGLDDSAALVQAKRRLGNSPEITRQLQASVSRWERLAVTPFPRWFRISAILIAVLLPLMIAIIPAPAWLTAQHPWGTAPRASASELRHARFALAGAIVVFELYAYFSAFFMGKAFNFAIGIARGHWSRIIFFGLPLIPVQLLGHLFLSLALTGQMSIRALAPSAFILTAVLVGLALLVSLIHLPVHEWRSLDIAE